ncbi:Vwa8, partial [Symbiodinium microadriaticum]
VTLSEQGSEIRPTPSEAFRRIYPVASLSPSAGAGGAAVRDAAEQLLRHFDLWAEEPAPLTVLPSSSPASSSSGTLRLRLQHREGHEGTLSVRSPQLPAPATQYLAAPRLAAVVAAMAQDYAAGSDCLLLGSAGCGKSAMARHLAGLLGFGAPGGRGLEFFFLHEEMSSRDLLQRRATNDDGDTVWVDSPLIRAARTGSLCILDGAHRLKGDALCALAPLLQDRQASLAVAGDSQGAAWELILRSDRFDHWQTVHGPGQSFDAVAGCRVAGIHPAFKVLALGEPPTSQHPWLTEEVAACFATHSYPEQRPEDLVQLLAEVVPSLPTAAAQRFVAAVAEKPSEPQKASQPEEGRPSEEAPKAPSERLVVPIRVILRVARAAAVAGGDHEVELLHGILQQQLFPFMPKGERAKLLAQLAEHFGTAAAEKDSVQFGECVVPVGKPKHPELVPSVDFVGIDRHVDLLEELGKAIFQRRERFLLLLGPQGVGKNRVVDYFLQTVAMEREYMQLHRDTTVSQLTVTPVVSDGRLYHEDSPLVRAAQFGRALVLDEADKAPLEVVVILKSLIEDGQLALPDGRRLAAATEATAGEGGAATLQVHPEFRMFVLANRPGFPFLGNDLLREADVFSVFCLDNPDATSELQLARAVGPNVPDGLLRTLVALFADLRLALEDGRLQYPYSARELLAVIRHLERFHNEPLEEALSSVLAFDRFDASLREALRPILERRGVSSLAVLGPASGDGGPAPTPAQPWLRALEVLRSARLARSQRLSKEPAGTWQVKELLDYAKELQSAEPRDYHEVKLRPAILDPAKAVPLAELAFDRSSGSFDEGLCRARLPLGRHSGGVVDAVVDGSTLHLLSTGPLCIWSVEDPHALGADAGRCSLLQVGPSADWSLAMATRETMLSKVAQGYRGIVVNGRPLALGCPQLGRVPGADALLLHSPLESWDDALAPQLLIERPSEPVMRAYALHAQPLQHDATATSRIRPTAEECFVMVVPNWDDQQAGRTVVDGPVLDLDEVQAAVGAKPSVWRQSTATPIFAPTNVMIFFQPKRWRVVQMDLVRERTREVWLERALPESLKSRWMNSPGPVSVSATATASGVEMLLALPGLRGDGVTQIFASLYFPAATDAKAAAAAPKLRLVESSRGADPKGGVLPIALPAGPGPGVFAVPFGSEAPLAFAAADDEEASNTAVAHVLDGLVHDDGSKGCWAYCAPAQSSYKAPAPQVEWPASAEDLSKASEDQIKALVAAATPDLPAPRHLWQSRDVASLGDGELLIRALTCEGHADWLEFVHLPTRSLRQLPAWQPKDAANSRDASVGAAAVARLLPWIGASLPGEDAASDTQTRCARCVASFESGEIRWVEAHPASLARSLTEHFQRQGLRGLLEEKFEDEDNEEDEAEEYDDDMEEEDMEEFHASEEEAEVSEDEGEDGTEAELAEEEENEEGGELSDSGEQSGMQMPSNRSTRRKGGRSQRGRGMSGRAAPGRAGTGRAGSAGAPAGGRAGGRAGRGGTRISVGKPVARPGGRSGGRGREGQSGRGGRSGPLMGKGGGRANARGAVAGGGGRAPGRGGRGGPQGVRQRLLRRALRQRRQQQKTRDLSLSGGRQEMSGKGQAKDVSSPKHGDEDDKEHIGGNRWAGGTGGADTAGLGGRGGPYRLEKPGQRVRQVSDEAKAQVSQEAKEAARQLGEEALKRRLEEIHLSGGDYNFYSSLLEAVQGEVERLRAVLSGAAARQRERHWRRGSEGELDETRLVDALAGESNVFRRRREREPRPGEPPMQPKRALFLFDASASMYRFNGTDGRLRRTCETAVMIMEALQGLESRFDYSLCCHDGDSPLQELVPFGQPPADERARLTVVSKLVAAAQYCSSGDNTLEAIEKAVEKVATSGPADDRFVFAFSDANFERYGLTAQALGKAMNSQGPGSADEVRCMLFLLATFEDEALTMANSLPDQVRLCLDPRTLPSELRQEFASRMGRLRKAWAILLLTSLLEGPGKMGCARMTKPKRPKYETVQYTPPTPQVFGSQLPSDIPVSKPPSTSSSFSVDRPRNRPKLQDRLAVYEDDNPRCQQLICTIGILFPPLWLVGAAMYAATPPAKTATRE